MLFCCECGQANKFSHMSTFSHKFLGTILAQLRLKCMFFSATEHRSALPFQKKSVTTRKNFILFGVMTTPHMCIYHDITQKEIQTLNHISFLADVCFVFTFLVYLSE